jgi:FkbM family methyltransferase
MGANFIARALNPCFLHRTDILVQACWRKLRPRPTRCVAQTAWGDSLAIEPRKFIGSSIYMRGVHELPVCEVLWRLAEPGDGVADVGANIGVMTSLLSRRVGTKGRVLAFEPHPGLFRELERNVLGWGRPQVELFNRAVSCRTGVVKLQEDDRFTGNEGTARVADSEPCGKCFEVEAVRLDDLLSSANCGVTKIDVEGHESEVLAGAAGCLATHRLRDIVFESSWDYPGPAHETLLGFNYEVFEIQANLGGPMLRRVYSRSGRPERIADYLATVDTHRTMGLVGENGWKVLRRSRPNPS